MSEIWGHLGARLIASGEVRNQQAKGGEGSGSRLLALAAFLVAWKVSLRSPCATADSQRTICIIIRMLQLQIKKEKINKIGKINNM